MPQTDSIGHAAVEDVGNDLVNDEALRKEPACFGCGRRILGESTFMYGDHEFCTEKCRGKQINLDRKLQKTASMARDEPSVLRDTCSKYRMEAVFLPAKVTTFDGTLLMQDIGIRTILARITRGFERKDLVNFVSGKYHHKLHVTAFILHHHQPCHHRFHRRNIVFSHRSNEFALKAGLVRWKRGDREYIMPVLMLFKTES